MTDSQTPSDKDVDSQVDKNTNPPGGSEPAIPMGKRPSFRRRQFVINPNFQWRMVSWGAQLTSVLMICVYFYDLFLIRTLEESAIQSGLLNKQEWQFLIGDFELKRAIWFSVFIFVVFVVVIAFYVLMSHRIAGPIYRTVKFLNEELEGMKNAPNQTSPKGFEENTTPEQNSGVSNSATEAPAGLQHHVEQVERKRGYFQSELRFRKKDFFPELASAINKKLSGRSEK